MNENINERIKQIRKESGLTQSQFAEQIGLRQNSIALLESGKRMPSDQTILSICREFRVQQEWLRTGEGEMFRKQTPKSQRIMDFAASIARNDDEEFRKRFVAMLADLDPKDWALLERMAEKIVKKEGASKKAPSQDE